MTNAFEEVDYVIKTLKTSELDEPKTLVLLSSVMSWYNTPAKFKEEKKEEDADDDAQDDDAADDDDQDDDDDEKKDDDDGEPKGPVDDEGNPIEIAKPLFFKEGDYHLRVPHEHYQHFKTLETLALSSTNTQPMLRVHVLCSGIRYGNGERTFYDHMQQAWIQNPNALTIVG